MSEDISFEVEPRERESDGCACFAYRGEAGESQGIAHKKRYIQFHILQN